MGSGRAGFPRRSAKPRGPSRVLDPAATPSPAPSGPDRRSPHRAPAGGARGSSSTGDRAPASGVAPRSPHPRLNWFAAKGEIALGVVKGTEHRRQTRHRKARGFRTYEVPETAPYPRARTSSRTRIHPQILLRRHIFIILGLERRRLIFANVTANPAEWLAQQVVNAFPWDTAPRFLIRNSAGSPNSVTGTTRTECTSPWERTRPTSGCSRGRAAPLASRRPRSGAPLPPPSAGADRPAARCGVR